MSVLITGATGFVGVNLISYLSKSKIMTSVLTKKDFIDRNYFQLDTSNAVVHLAGKAHDLRKSHNTDDYSKVNFELTKELYEAFAQSKCEKFIFISSVKASADHLDEVLTEDRVPNPQTPYGYSKLKAEQFIESIPLPYGKSFYILRPCMIHGPGNKGNLNLLYKLIFKGIPYPLAAFENKRSFLGVDNLCFVVQELINRDDIPSGIYNVADNEPLSTNQLVTLISEAIGKRAKLLRINPSIIKFIAKVGDVLALPINSERLGKLTENYVVSNHKLISVLKKNLPVTAKEGIIKTIHSF